MFRQLAIKYIRWLGRMVEADIEKNVLVNLAKNSGANYLDCGGGDGKKTITRSRAIGTKNIFTIEVVDGLAKRMSKLGIVVLTSDLNKKWNIKTDSIDVITATEVVEHLVDLDNFFAESKRVLKKNGVIIISTENLASWHNIFALIFGNQPYSGPYLSKKYSIGHRPNDVYHKDKQRNLMPPHLNVATGKSLVSLVEKNGFKINKWHGIGYYPLPKPLCQIAAYLDKWHASYTFVSAIKQ